MELFAVSMTLTDCDPAAGLEVHLESMRALIGGGECVVGWQACLCVATGEVHGAEVTRRDVAEAVGQSDGHALRRAGGWRTGCSLNRQMTTSWAEVVTGDVGTSFQNAVGRVGGDA